MYPDKMKQMVPLQLGILKLKKAAVKELKQR